MQKLQKIHAAISQTFFSLFNFAALVGGYAFLMVVIEIIAISEEMSWLKGFHYKVTIFGLFLLFSGLLIYLLRGGKTKDQK